ncbi:MAG TPA: beta-L-arabinofuranosidase domain-containing protein, partial [Povalibacter sp.]
MPFRFLLALSAALAIGAVSAAPVKPALETFALSDVQLLDSPFKQAMERNAEYLLLLDPDRLLHNTRQYAGLEPKGELYGGWESQGIAGHTLGHYLTALSQQYVATGDRRFRERIDYIIGEMAECQRAYGDGYIGALPPTELAALRGLKEGKVAVKGAFNFANDAWVPWYTEHKVLAGLKDAWVLAGSEQAKEVTLKFADWVDAVTANLSPEQLQTMLSVEHGGMRESLIDLYARTGNERYLATSRRFYHHAVLDPLTQGRDELPGRHANTQIPKVTGAARSYEVTGDESDRKAAVDFWKIVTRDHSWVIGGNSEGEHFFSPNTASAHLSATTAETCNTYNMLKLTEHLFTWQPQIEYADYYERALYNHILASQEPERGMFAYYMSLKPGFFRTYSTPFDSFWCCVGSGMENHTKYGEAIYFHGSDDLYVNLFIPSRVDWKQRGFSLEQRTEYPRSQQTELVVSAADNRPLTLRIRVPAWSAGPLTARLNGKPLQVEGMPGTYAAVTRTWRKGDRLSITIPFGVHTEALHGSPATIAFLYGPLVLAADLGAVNKSDTVPYSKDHVANLGAPDVAVPVLTADLDSIALKVKPVPGEPLTFKTQGIGKPADVVLR